MARFLSCLCDPIDDPSADDANVAVPSNKIKVIVLGLCLAALAISITVITVCATTGKKDMPWWIALVCVGLAWFVVAVLAGTLFTSHPYYKAKMMGWFRCKGHEELPNPLLDEEEISL
jgi:uncharacterized membrane protein